MTTVTPGSVARRWRTKFEPMNPHPPVTSSVDILTPRLCDEQRFGPYRFWHHRHTFDNDWNSVARVVVRNAHGEPPNRATATLTYHYKDGRAVTEQTHFTFVRQDGVLKIDGER